MADPIRVRAEMNKGQKVHLLEYDAPIRVPDGTIKMLPFLREVPDPNEGTTVDPLGYAIVALHNLYQEKCQEITYLKRELDRKSVV